MVTIEEIVERIAGEERVKFLFFWGHAEKNRVTKACLSQWYESSFTKEGIYYRTAEHWIMARKAELFGDKEALERIVDAKSPGEAKALGRGVKGFLESEWNAVKVDFVIEGNLLKFSQNEELGFFLLNTKSRILVEASPQDAI